MSPELIAMLAVVLVGIAILPGTLGILKFTNRFAASPGGARFIYSQAGILVAVAVGLLAYALYVGITTSSISIVLAFATAATGGLLVYGYLMHAKFLFRPVRKPVFISGGEALKRFGPEEEVVGVVDSEGRPYAFVARLARRPHIVYQTQGDAPFIMTHCILAHSSMSYALEGRFRAPDITITAALANNMVFYEKNSRCSVVQIHNRLEGRNERLSLVPTVMTSLKTWVDLYPESPVWMRPLGWRDVFYLKLLSRAEIIDPDSPVIIYPLENDLDRRLPMKSRVLGVSIDGQQRAYPETVVAQRKVINDRLGETKIAVIAHDDFMQVYDRKLPNGDVLTFAVTADPDVFVDNESGSRWSPTGRAIGGDFEGAHLTPVPHYNKIFWFVWADYFPDCEIYGAEAEPERASAAAPAGADGTTSSAA